MAGILWNWKIFTFSANLAIFWGIRWHGCKRTSCRCEHSGFAAIKHCISTFIAFIAHTVLQLLKGDMLPYFTWSKLAVPTNQGWWGKVGMCTSMEPNPIKPKTFLRSSVYYFVVSMRCSWALCVTTKVIYLAISKLMFVVRLLFPDKYIAAVENGVPHLFMPATAPQEGERWNQKLSFVRLCKKTKSKQNPVWNASWIIKINNFIKKKRLTLIWWHFIGKC